MKHTLAILRALLIILGSSSMLHAQVFIPTQLERDWLNDLIPGVVNGDGIMDTLHVGIETLSAATLDASIPEGTTLVLEGLRYLDSLHTFVFNMPYTSGTAIFIEIPGVPGNLRSMQFFVEYPMNLSLPILPISMDNLELLTYSEQGASLSLSVAQMPDTIQDLILSGFENIDWPGIPYANRIEIRGGTFGGIQQTYSTLVLPTIVCQDIQVGSTFCTQDLDLSNISTAELMTLTDVYINGTLYLPNGLDIASLDGDIYSLGALPATLRVLNVYSVIGICLPWLPNSIEWMQLEGVDCLPNWPSQLTLEQCQCPSDENNEAIILCSVLNSDCPGVNPGIAGRLFIDMDQDGMYDSVEPPLPQASVTLNPGGIGAGCDQQGLWEIGVLPGTYSITPSTNYPYAQAYSPAVHAGNVPNMGDADTLNDFAATLIPNIQDLQTWLYADPARPGFDNRLFLNYRNYGTMPVNSTLTLQWDADQQWVGSSVTPTSLSDNTATWALGTLALAVEGLLTVDLNTLATVPLDTPIEHLLTASPVLGDEAPYDNVAVYNDVVVGSYDPNDKLLSPAAMSPAQLQDPTARIEYTVRFQNTGTFQAERVVILDTLPEGLILESIQFLASSHPNTWYLTGGVLHVIHNNVMLPDSTSDEPNSHGFIRFSIKPEPTLDNGSTIANIAHIIFDFNAPIITPPAVFTVDVLASVNEVQRGTWSLWPNPTRDLLRLTATDGALANQPCLVRDITGRTVMTSNTSAAGDLPVGTLANGTYTVQINGQVEVLRFVKE